MKHAHALIAALAACASGIVTQTSADDSQKVALFFQTYCNHCHSGEESAGDIDLSTLKISEPTRHTPSRSDRSDTHRAQWDAITDVIRHGLMPPADEDQPTAQERDDLLGWHRRHFLDPVIAHPGFFRPRRLAVYEYRNSLDEVLGFPLETAVAEAEQTVAEKSLVVKLLPPDPPGPSRFTNDTSANPITSRILDLYSSIADFALDELLATGNEKRVEHLIGPRNAKRLSAAHAKTLISEVARRAYRRPVPQENLENAYANIDRAAPDALASAVRIELKSILMSPRFLYRGFMVNAPTNEVTAVDDFELAERLSYFLWASPPDDVLAAAAASGELSNSTKLREQIDRMLKSPKARSLAENMATEWLSLNEIDNVSNNPPVAEALKSQPIDFLEDLFTSDRPLIELIDSQTTFINVYTAKYYPGDRSQLPKQKRLKGIEGPRSPNHRIALSKSLTHRGGLLTMPGVLAMNRGPVLRGTWILERILGDHLPEPPANVGQVKANAPGEELTFRQRFEQHRSNTACAVCHDKLDPLGFALQLYDNSGTHLIHESPSNQKKKGRSKDLDPDNIDTSGRLPTGESFSNFQELKTLLTTVKRQQVTRNIIERFLSYAICRELDYYDTPTVDKLAGELNAPDASYRDLIYAIAESLPFQQTYIASP